MIRIEGLNAGYGPLQVLRDITLDVGEGEIVAVLKTERGCPNGMGRG